MVANCNQGAIPLKSNRNSKKPNFLYQQIHQKNHIFMLISNIEVSSSLPIRSYNLPEKIFLFLKKEKTPPKSHRILMKITPSDSAYQRNPTAEVSRSYLQNVKFCIFCQKKDHGCVFICLFFLVILST